MKLLFFGSDSFSAVCLDAFCRAMRADRGGDFLVDLVTHRTSPLSGGYPGLPGRVLVLGEKSLSGLGLQHHQYDFGLVASFGMFIPWTIIRTFTRAMLNVHPSMLPKYRGPSPIQYALRNMDLQTGVSIIDVHPKVIDGGAVYQAIASPIDRRDTFDSLSRRLADLGGTLLAKTVLGHAAAVPREQAGDAVMTGKIRRSDARVSFSDMTAAEVEALFRAIGHQETLFVRRGEQLILFKNVNIAMGTPDNLDGPHWHRAEADAPPGAVFLEGPAGCLWVKTRRGWITCSRFRMNSSPILYSAGQVFSALHCRNFTAAFS